MQRMKKILSALLAVVMLVSVLSIYASAGAPAPTGGALVSVHYEVVDSDGNAVSSVKSGDVVTVNVYSNAATAGDAMTGFNIAIFWDSNVYTYVADSLQWLGVLSSLDTANSSMDVVSSGTHYTNIQNKLTPAEKAAHPNWNTMAYAIGIQDASKAAYYPQVNANSPMYSFKLQVNDGVAESTNADIGTPASCVQNAKTRTYCAIKTAATGTRITTEKVTAPAVCVISVATPAPAGPTVAKSKGQIKMTKTGADTVADDFSFRVISKITDADWDAYFSGTLDSDTELGATNAIQKVGFVVAESGNFAMDGAKAAAKKYAESANPDAEDLGVYKVATTNFIQKTDDASDALFACRIDTSVSTKSDRKYIAFVQYKDGDGNIQYAFYDDAQEILLDSKYGDYKAAWLSQN